MTAEDRIEIQLLDRQFHIKCPAENQSGLKQAAKYLDQKMREFSDGTQMLSIERIAVMAALSIVYELLFANGKSQYHLSPEMVTRIEKLSQRINHTLYTEAV